MSPLAPYAKDHEDPNGPGDARPSALKIVRDQDLDGKLAGVVFFITGCTSGIGLETARAIHATGADVYFTDRDPQKGQEAVTFLERDGKPGRVVYIEMHLDSLDSIRRAAAEFLKKSDKLNVLICNAGIRGYPKGKTVDGFELHLGVNHLGHFDLFQALKEALLRSSTSAFRSRVVCVSASGHRQSKIRFDDFHFDKNADEYQPLLGYAQSKTANILMAFEIERRYGADGLHGLAVHPGGIANTGLNRLTPAEAVASVIAQPDVFARMKSAEQGAATTVWAAVARIFEGSGGRFLEDCQESRPWDGNPTVLAPGHAPHIHDKASAARLWEESLGMVGLAVKGAEEIPQIK